MSDTGPLRAALAQALPDRPFQVQFWDGSVLAASNGAGGPAFRIRSPRALAHVLRAPGQLGLGRAYVTGDLEVEDLDGVLALVDGYRTPPIDARTKARIAVAAVRAGALRSIPRAPAAE